MLVVAFFTLVATVYHAAALTCFETSQDGVAEMKTDPSWEFCGYTLKWTVEGGLDVAYAFGISDVTDSLEGFDAMFAKRDVHYELLDLCIHEKYDLRGLSPKFTADGLEFVLRCACNQDMCNGDVGFQALIEAGMDN